jgi:hypothetical protein
VTFGRLSAFSANGSREHSEDDTPSPAVTDVSFDHSPAEETAVEPTTAVLEPVEIPEDRELEVGAASQEPAAEPMPTVTVEPSPTPETNGHHEYRHDEVSVVAEPEHPAAEEMAEAEITVEAAEAIDVPDVTDDLSVEEDTAPDEVVEPDHSFVSVQPLTNAPQRSTARSSTRQPMAFAWLAVAIGLLVLLMSRSRRQRS